MIIRDLRSLRAFLSLASYYRRFIPVFGSIAAPLHALLKKKAVWCWRVNEEMAKDRLVALLTTALVLAHFNDELDVITQTDASGGA